MCCCCWFAIILQNCRSLAGWCGIPSHAGLSIMLYWVSKSETLSWLSLYVCYVCPSIHFTVFEECESSVACPVIAEPTEPTTLLVPQHSIESDKSSPTVSLVPCVPSLFALSDWCLLLQSTNPKVKLVRSQAVENDDISPPPPAAGDEPEGSASPGAPVTATLSVSPTIPVSYAPLVCLWLQDLIVTCFIASIRLKWIWSISGLSCWFSLSHSV